MRKTLSLSLEELKPERSEVLVRLGMTPQDTPTPRINNLIDEAMEIFMDTAVPVAILSEISIPEFSNLFKGNGQNEKSAPLGNIFPRADALAIFAFTLGGKISKKIECQFEKKDFAHGTILDAVASGSAEKAVEVTENRFQKYLQNKNNHAGSKATLLYSPGYCGWHVGGQKKLFQYLRPEDIGISLNDSCLMIPLKSVSGVLVTGNPEIHLFKNKFDFCKLCRNQSCKKRMDNIKKIKMEDKYGTIKTDIPQPSGGG